MASSLTVHSKAALRPSLLLLLVLLLELLLQCQAAHALSLRLVFGAELPSALPAHVTALLQQVNVSLSNATQADVFACGSTAYFTRGQQLAAMGPEAYIVDVHVDSQGRRIVAAAGNAPTPLRRDAHYSLLRGRGSAFACVAALEAMGFAFLHPLQPLVPSTLAWGALTTIVKPQPRWPLRGFHIHTQHPLELTDLLTGFDVIVNKTIMEPWASMLPDWQNYLLWSLAQGLNRVEWLPLEAKDWAAYALSTERQQRFKQLTDLAHGYGLHAGADASIAEQQQHAFTLINDTADTTHAVASIYQRMQWLQLAGFDFLSTENGFSEFTHPNCVTMLTWINATAAAADASNMTSFIKVHCSSGQTCPQYKDPRTGEPINFNYLPELADPRMGLMPHTVQLYNFTDPANTYGNANFTEMLDFLTYHLSGDQQIVNHGETTYWVNYDIDVPLFLPIYAVARLSDYRAIAEREDAAKVRIQGQMVFDSGWEWGYWLADVVTARASWDPCTNCSTTIEAFSQGLDPIVAVMGSNVAEDFRALLTQFVQDEHALLVLGRYSSSAPQPSSDAGYANLNGMAYMAGWDTVAELSAMFAPDDATQPSKLQFDAARLNKEPHYWQQVRPILAAMNETFGNYYTALLQMQPRVSAFGAGLFQELVDSMQITWLRARLLYALYDFAASWDGAHGDHKWRLSRVADANATMLEAVATVARRESHYRVPVDRIAGWRNSSTAYRFNYIWTVHSLYFWWRDYAKALLTTPETLSPCFRNIQDPVDVAIGEGNLNNITALIQEWLEHAVPGLDFLSDCLDPPIDEPHYGF